MMRFARTMCGALCAIAMFAFAACGGNEIVPEGSIGETNSATVTAATGGSVALASNAAVIAIPGGALSQDTTISINTLDNAGAVDEGKLGSFIFDFGPDGTQFNSNVTITLKTGGDTPSGKKAVLAYLDGDKWVEVAGSGEVNGEVVGAVNHFTKFVIYYTEKEIVVENGDEICKDLEFEACGGDPTGEWAVEGYCLDSRHIQTATNPYEQVPQCANGNSQYAVNIEWLGSATLNSDGTYTTHMGNHVTFDIMLNDECLLALGAGQLSASQMCTKMTEQSGDQGLIYSYGSGKCTASKDNGEEWNDPSSGTWAIVDGQLKMDNDEEGIDYCVKGGYLYMQNIQGDDTNDDGVDDVFYTDIMVFKKK